MIEIHFDDLTREKQQELLEAYGIAGPAEMNWDAFPLTLFPLPEEGDFPEEGDAAETASEA